MGAKGAWRRYKGWRGRGPLGGRTTPKERLGKGLAVGKGPMVVLDPPDGVDHFAHFGRGLAVVCHHLQFGIGVASMRTREGLGPGPGQRHGTGGAPWALLREGSDPTHTRTRWAPL